MRPKEIRKIPEGERGTYPFQVGRRVHFTIPERGGFGYGFGEILKINQKSLRVRDEKYPGGETILVDRSLVFEEIQF